MLQRCAKLTFTGILICISVASLGFCFSIMAQQAISKGTAVPADSAMKPAPDDSAYQAIHAAAISLMSKRCSACHSAKNPKAGLILDSAGLIQAVKDMPSRQVKALKLADTRHPEKSYFLMKLRGDKGIKGARMPVNAAPFSAAEIKTIERWIRLISRPPAAPQTAPAAADSAVKR